MTRVFLVHGWDGSPEGNWFPWLKRQLEEKGFAVIVPAMPNPDEPELDKWLKRLQDTAGVASENDFFVGHSVGCITILRYLETLPEGKKAGGAVLVAGFPEPIGYDEIAGFFVPPLDFEKVKRSADKFAAINSDNDPYVPVKQGEILRDRLGAELIVLTNAGHINTEGENKFTELPEALTKLLEMNNQKER
jgi:hypothetical protein